MKMNKGKDMKMTIHLHEYELRLIPRSSYTDIGKLEPIYELQTRPLGFFRRFRKWESLKFFNNIEEVNMYLTHMYQTDLYNVQT